MPKGYWIVRVDVKDEEPVKRYVAGNHPIFEKFGGRYLVRAQKFAVPEGSSRSLHVVIEFPDYASALGCYQSPEYQTNLCKGVKAMALRDHNSDFAQRPTPFDVRYRFKGMCR
jgi:uncharacterized protein (DUF1330 family)